MPDLLEKIDVLISDTSETESILELASKLAIYAAENARKRQRQRKDEMGELDNIWPQKWLTRKSIEL